MSRRTGLKHGLPSHLPLRRWRRDLPRIASLAFQDLQLERSGG